MRDSKMENEIVKTVHEMDLKETLNTTFDKNKVSHDKCIEYGNQLLSKASSNPMTDEMDEEIKTFITKAAKTLTTISERRKPITQMMDLVKKYFTGLENEINVKNDNIVGQLQGIRNNYAAEKIRIQKEQEAKAERERLITVEKSNIRNTAEISIRDGASRLISDTISKINIMFANVTLEDYDGVFNAFQNMKWENTFNLSLVSSVLLSKEEVTEIFKSAKNDLKEEITLLIDTSISRVVDELKLKLPSKKVELLRIKELEEKDAEEARKQREALAKKDAEDIARKNQEREEQDRIRKQSEALTSTPAEDLFMTPETVVNKVKVKQKMEITSSKAFINIIQYWWNGVGSTMSIDELTKKLQFAITFVEKEANKNQDNKIVSPDINWIDDVTAK